MEADIVSLILMGTTLGFWAGISPGPMLTLIISETLKFGSKTGVKVAVAPVLTDAPIVILSMLILSQISGMNNILAVISICGALFLLYLALENFRIKEKPLDSGNQKLTSLNKAILINFLNPNPYIFWMTIGGPLLLKGFNVSTLNGVSFLIAFYLVMIGTKIVIALVGGKIKPFLGSKSYITTLRVLGVLLIILAVILFIDAGQRIFD